MLEEFLFKRNRLKFSAGCIFRIVFFLSLLANWSALQAIAAPPAPETEAANCLILLHKNERIDQILSMESSSEKTALLEQLEWQNLSKEAKDKILLSAETTVNSFEINAFVDLAKTSNAPEWLPILTTWLQEWEEIKNGWQTYTRPKVIVAIKRLGGNVTRVTRTESQFGKTYLDSLGENFKSKATSDARAFIAKGKINFTSHSLSRAVERGLTEEEVLEALNSDPSGVVYYGRYNDELDLATFRWVGKTKKGRALRLIVSMTDRLNIITVSDTNLSLDFYFHPDYTPETAVHLYRRIYDGFSYFDLY